MKKIIPFLFLVVFGFLIFSCQEDEFTTNPDVKLQFSSDTVSFDTIFTTIGSVTQLFKVKNPQRKSINISSISLAGGEESPFRLNINGTATDKSTNVVIEGRDSIFIFVEVTIDPTGQNLPMVVNDSVIFNLNGNTQDVNLIAFGQDFHLFNGETIESQHWLNDKPYLVYNSIIVDTDETLTIDPGCRVHFHKGSSLFVRGTLQVNGTNEEPVTFQGDRLDEDYASAPGQWGAYTTLNSGSIYVYGGLHFLAGSVDNSINHATIKNAEKGIQVDTLGIPGNPVLTLQNTRIENMTLNCLDARTTFVKASNCIFANSGSYTVALRYGGDYEFNHCTVANYYTSTTRTTPALFLNNYYEYDDDTYDFDFSASFSNCIIYGNMSNEISYNATTSKTFEGQFNTCLLNTYLDSSDDALTFSNCIFNENPLFADAYEHNYSIDSLSPARNIADVSVANLFPTDLNNNSRFTDEGPDLGALEWIPTEEEE